MLDIKSFLKAQKAIWVKRIVTEDNASWKALPRLFLAALKKITPLNATCHVTSDL